MEATWAELKRRGSKGKFAEPTLSEMLNAHEVAHNSVSTDLKWQHVAIEKTQSKRVVDSTDLVNDSPRAKVRFDLAAEIFEANEYEEVVAWNNRNHDGSDVVKDSKAIFR